MLADLRKLFSQRLCLGRVASGSREESLGYLVLICSSVASSTRLQKGHDLEVVYIDEVAFRDLCTVQSNREWH